MKRLLIIAMSSFQANAVPAAVLWLLALGVVLCYYLVPGVAALFEPLARWQTEYGWGAAFLNRFFFCGVVPGIFLVGVKSLRPKFPFATAFAQGIWAGLSGVLFDAFYRCQADWFGTGLDWQTLLAKMAVDQFVLTAVFVAPLNVVVFFWISREFSARRTLAEFPRPFVARALMPNLIANWCVWIPVNLATYALPLSLQLQVSGFACAFWALTCLQIGRRSSSFRRAS